MNLLRLLIWQEVPKLAIQLELTAFIDSISSIREEFPSSNV